MEKWNLKDRKYNIAFLMHGARNIGGGEQSIFLLIKNLRKDIFKPIIFYACENEIINKIQAEGIETIKIPLHKSIISVYRNELKYNPVTMCFYLWHMAAGAFRIKALLKEKKIVLLHPHDNLSKIIGGIAAKTEGIRIVAHCRDDLKDNLIGNILRIAYIYLTDRVIAVSEKTSESLKRGNNSLNKKICIIYNGVDLNIFNPEQVDGGIRKVLKIPDEHVVLGIIGVLEKYKGHIYLFQAIEKLKLSGIKNLKCIVVGAGRESDELIQFAKDNNLSEDILFLGYRKDIPALLKAMDILVIPSIDQEAFPRVALEAMVMKVPVICTDFGGLPEAVADGETGVIVPTRDAEALYNAIKYLIEKPQIRKKMGEAGRKKVQDKFSIEINVRKTEELYLDILKKS